MILHQVSPGHHDDPSPDEDINSLVALRSPQQKQRRSAYFVTLFNPDIDRLFTEVSIPYQISGEAPVRTSRSGVFCHSVVVGEYANAQVVLRAAGKRTEDEYHFGVQALD